SRGPWGAGRRQLVRSPGLLVGRAILTLLPDHWLLTLFPCPGLETVLASARPGRDRGVPHVARAAGRGGWPQQDGVTRPARSRVAAESHASAARAPPDEGLLHRSQRHPAGHRGLTSLHNRASWAPTEGSAHALSCLNQRLGRKNHEKRNTSRSR